MATSGEHLGGCKPGSVSYVVGTLKWNRTSYSIDNNSTTINWSLEITNTGTPFIGDVFMPSSEVYVNINGANVYWSMMDAGIAVNKVKRLASGTTTIPHNPDGTKTFSIECGVSYVNTSLYINDTATLDYVPRPTVIETAPDFTSSNWPKITYKCPGTITGTVAACISFTGEKDDVPYRDIANPTNPGEYEFELTHDEQRTLYTAVKTGSSATVRFYIRNTINGVHYWSYLTKTYTLTYYTPTLEPVIIDTNERTKTLTGNQEKFIRYYSNAHITFNATARRGATLVSRQAINGKHKIDIEDREQDTVEINEVDSNTFYLTATDSRGNSTKEGVVKDFVDYVKLTNNIKTTALTTTNKLTFTISGKYFNGSFGAKANTLEVEYTVLNSSGNPVFNASSGGWVKLGTVSPTVDGSDYTYSYTISGLDYKQTYTLTVNVIDELTPVQSSTKVVSATPVFDWDRDDFKHHTNVYIDNNKTLRSYQADGTDIQIMGVNTSNNLVLGWGGYDNGNGDTGVYGNNVRLVSQNDIYINNAILGDFVVEQGDDGLYAYRKWNSGLMEAWRSTNNTITTSLTSTYGTSTHYYSPNLALTTSGGASAFKTVEDVQLTINKRSTSGFFFPVLASWSIATSGAVTVNYIVVNPTSVSSVALLPCVRIIGRWK